jgi:hypothetical protein
MRARSLRALGRLIGAAAWLSALALASCSEPHEVMPLEPGVATVAFRPQPFNLPSMSLDTAELTLRSVRVLGNALPPPPQGQPPPPGLPPPPPPDGGFHTSPDIDLDVLSTGSTATLSRLPQGLYSRVRFSIDGIAMKGRWYGTPFEVTLAPFMNADVDLRASTPQELGLGSNIAFDVTVDPEVWFSTGVFENATLTNGEIVCNDQINTAVGGILTDHIVSSFSLP